MNGRTWSDPRGFGLESFKRCVCALGMAIFLICSQPILAQLGEEQRPIPADPKTKLATGPEVGQRIPYFRASDQNGNIQDFNSIRGTKGAMIVFVRSADW